MLDKGTIDALLWSMDPAGNVYRLLSEASRVVKEGGTFMYIGYGVPDARLHHLAHPDHHFDVQFWTINKLPEFMLIQAKASRRVHEAGCAAAIASCRRDGRAPMTTAEARDAAAARHHRGAFRCAGPRGGFKALGDLWDAQGLRAHATAPLHLRVPAQAGAEAGAAGAGSRG